MKAEIIAVGPEILTDKLEHQCSLLSEKLASLELMSIIMWR